MPQTPVEHLLRDLDSPAYDEAWTEFLSDYSAHIYQVIRRFEPDVDNAADCFQFVCERLIENRSRRLRKFKGEGSATFVTWLRAVVRNLCIDWHRKQFGRHRQFRSIGRLSVFDQAVFRVVYERAVSPEQCRALLAAEFPNATESRINESKARIETVLTPNQRWLLTKRSGNTNEQPDAFEQSENALADLADSGASPESRAIEKESREKLERALAKLSPSDRLLIRLRFEEDLTLAEVGKLLGLGNAQRTDRQIKEILTNLRKLMS